FADSNEGNVVIMADRKVYAKSSAMRSDFVYVDLLPNLKRTRQFNVNVLFTVLFAVLLTYFLIYLPYRNVSDDLSELNGINNDLNYELILVNEEIRGYDINVETLDFQANLYDAENLTVDVNKYISEVNDKIAAIPAGAESVSFVYNLDENVLIVKVKIKDDYDSFFTLDDSFQDLSWLIFSTLTDPKKTGDPIYSEVTYTLGVDYNAE
ncbi:MAG: hypothetical protein QM489_07040, partial [Candidatus Izemoplasma sp.]